MSDQQNQNPGTDEAEDEVSAKFKRVKPRYAVDLKVEVFTKGLNHVVIERAANISTGGLFICTDLAAAHGDKMHLRIIFSDKESYFDVKSQVVWVCPGNQGHPKGLGVQFIDLTKPQIEVIQRFLVNYVNVRER